MLLPKPRPYTDVDQYQQEHDRKTGYFSYAGFRTLQFLPGSNSYLYISHTGEERCEPGHYFGKTRPEYHMHFILKGKGAFQVGDTTWQLGRGDIFVTPKNQVNAYQADWDNPWHYVWVAFDGSRAWQYLEQAGFSREKLTRQCFAPPEQYAELIHDILEARNLTHANELRRMGSLYALFSLLIRSRLEEGPGAGTHHALPAGKYVNHAVQYIKSNYSTTSVAEVADYVGLNRSYLTTLFKQEMQMSPQEYLIRYRMEKAARLLETTGRPIGEIAVAVGYEDPLSFTKVFHRTYGLSPREYRKFRMQE